MPSTVVVADPRVVTHAAMHRPETLEAVQREARERLYPSLTNPNWLVLRSRRKIFERWLTRVAGNNLSVLDLGGRIQPYRPLLEERVQKYVAIDLRKSPLVNLIADGSNLPLASSSFDLVLCTQVLEYVPQPATAVAEIHRVLKPGGVLLLSAPSVFPRDADEDAWRFLPRSLRLLMSPFAEVEIAPEGTSVAGLFRTICVCLQIFLKPRFLWSAARFTLIPVLNLLGHILESILPTSNDQFTANFSVLARK